MTREEAIQILTEHKNEYFHTSRIENAIDTAIDALTHDIRTETHACVKDTHDSDLISRAEANNEICEVIMQEFDVPPTRGYEVSEKILKLLPSTDRPTLKQTDTLIIADALRYLAEDEERHEIDRARAEKLREQVLAYGARMCADRPMGEWQKAYRKTANGVDFRVIECNKCGFADAQMNYYHYCPNCGARMGNDDDDLDGLKIIAIIDGEGGSE